MEILTLVALILLNGMFAMSEMALVTARRARLQKLIDEGDSAAAAAVKLGEDPTRFMSTIQIGITSIGVLNGIVGESALAGPVARRLVDWTSMTPERAAWVSTALVVALITYASIVVGELVPKRLGQVNPERVARIVAKPITWLAIATTPFVKLLTSSTQALLRLLGVRARIGSDLTEEDLHAVLAEGTSAGVIESNEHAMVRNVFRLDDRQIGSLMVPRGDIVTLDVEDDWSTNFSRIEDSDHARFPVVRGGFSQLLGIVTARQLLSLVAKGTQPDLEAIAHPPVFVPETLTGLELLESFRASSVQMAFVIDEYGEVQGMITLQDLVEAITGEFHPRDPESSWAVQRDDGSWLLDGHIPIPELKDTLQLATVPEEDRGRYHTLSGMMMLLTGRLPEVADSTEWKGWRLEIIDMDGRTIDKVLATRIDDVVDEGSGPSDEQPMTE